MSQSSQCNLIALPLAAVHLALEIIKWETEMTNKPEIQTEVPPGNAKQMASERRLAQRIAIVLAGRLLTAPTVVASFLWACLAWFASWCPCHGLLLRGENKLESPLNCKPFAHPLIANRETDGHWRARVRVRNNSTFLCHRQPTVLPRTGHLAITKVTLMCAFRKNWLFSMLPLKCLLCFHVS